MARGAASEAGMVVGKEEGRAGMTGRAMAEGVPGKAARVVVTLTRVVWVGVALLVEMA